MIWPVGPPFDREGAGDGHAVISGADMGTTVPNGLCGALDDAFHMLHLKRHRRFGCCTLMAAGPRRGSGADLEGVADVPARSSAMPVLPTSGMGMRLCSWAYR